MLPNSSFSTTGRAHHSRLKSALESYLATGETTPLESIHGEWNLVYWAPHEGTLAFGRDLFGRKSLCWRIVDPSIPLPQLDDHGMTVGVKNQGYSEQNSIIATPALPLLQISPFPNEQAAARVAAAGSGGWNELHPGTIFILRPSKKISNAASSEQRSAVDCWGSVKLNWARSSSCCASGSSSQSDGGNLVVVDNTTATMPTVLPDLSAQLPPDFPTRLELTVLSWHSERELREANELLLNQFEQINFQRNTGAKRYFDIRPPLGMNDRQQLDGLIRQAAREFLEQLENSLRGIERDFFPLPNNATATTTELTPRMKQPDLPASPSSTYKTAAAAAGSAPTGIGVLFSGGVDSLMVATMAGRVLPANTVETITLINVAFGESAADFDAVPDRKRAIRAFQYLRNATATTSIPANASSSPHPHQQQPHQQQRYRLLLVDVLKEELAQCRREHIAGAIAPCSSVLDDSLGCVLWFATRARGRYFSEEGGEVSARVGGGAGQGEVHSKHSKESPASSVGRSGGEMYVPPPSLLLVGSGADEQLGGYGRHRTAFERGGWEAVQKELEMEMRRIGARNFGRDDRVATSNGRTLIAPFLEERFVEWLAQIPLDLKVDFTLPRGHGEKRLMRLALLELGVPAELAESPKQAMQFGSRMARLERRGEKGGDLCERLQPSAPQVEDE